MQDSNLYFSYRKKIESFRFCATSSLLVFFDRGSLEIIAVFQEVIYGLNYDDLMEIPRAS